MSQQIDQLIINSPYIEPAQHWSFQRDTRRFELLHNRRPAGYIKATPNAQSFDDPGEFVEIPLVNRIRPRVKAWRAQGYPGATGVSRALLRHWYDRDPKQERCFFFCQLEAIETLIWLKESPAADRVGIQVPSDGGGFPRWCSKMATGSGKTVVMSMIVAWQVLNKVAYPNDRRYSRFVFVVAPNLTVKKRLQVLEPSASGNYYEAFNIVPFSQMENLRQGHILVENWHLLAWDSQAQLDKKIERGQLRSVDRRKRQAVSPETYVKQRLGPLANARNLVVLNDEAHHAWRVNPTDKRGRASKEEEQTATVWVGGLDRIHQQRNILQCFDLSATPFAPSGKKAEQEALFPWVVSDFGLNDAIESGLVKTPRVVVRESGHDQTADRLKLYHLYNEPEVKDSLKGKASPAERLPGLVVNAYYLLGLDWRATKEAWEKQGHVVPPVLLTVANRVETSARIQYAFREGYIRLPDLGDPKHTLRIDSEVLKRPQNQLQDLDLGADPPDLDRLTLRERQELLQRVVDTVGKPGQLGQHVRNVLSVGMLSEGWDAQTVTHIMGLRAFASQLLCEQVIGRGLRRVSYEVNEQGLFEPEYVNIFGVPFSFLPHEGTGEGPPPPPKPTTRIEPDPQKRAFEIKVPHLARLDFRYKSDLSIDWNSVPTLHIDHNTDITRTRLAALIDGHPHLIEQSDIELDQWARATRMQTLYFHIARNIYHGEAQARWTGNHHILFARLVRLIEAFFDRGHVQVARGETPVDSEAGRISCMIHLDRIVRHVWRLLRSDSTEGWTAVFHQPQTHLFTGGIRPWSTTQTCQKVTKCHLTHCAYKGIWEQTTPYALDRAPEVAAFVRNDGLRLHISYLDGSIVRRFRPDYIVRLHNGVHLLVVIQQRQAPLDDLVQEQLNRWVEAVTAATNGREPWVWTSIRRPGELFSILKHYASEGAPSEAPV